MAHWSDCPVNNAPALPVGVCTCGNDTPLAVPADWVCSDEMLERYPNGRPATEYHRLNFGKLD